MAIRVYMRDALRVIVTLALRTGLACGSPRATDGFMCHALDAKKPRSFRNGAGSVVVVGYPRGRLSRSACDIRP